MKSSSFTKLSRETWLAILIAASLLAVYFFSDERSISTTTFEVQELIYGLVARSTMAAFMLLLSYQVMLGILCISATAGAFMKYVLGKDDSIPTASWIFLGLCGAYYLYVWIVLFPQVKWH